MPTASKLFAATAFAIVAWLAVHAYIPTLPEGTQTKGFREIAALVGFLCGWRVMGRQTGKGYVEAASKGLLTSVVTLFWLLLGFSIYVMIQRSTKMIYDGPMEAVVAVFGLMLDYAKLLAAPATPLVLAIGGVIGGWLAEFAGKRWS